MVLYLQNLLDKSQSINADFPVVCVCVYAVAEMGDSLKTKSAMMFHLEFWIHFRVAAPILLATTQKAPPTVHHDGISLKKMI